MRNNARENILDRLRTASKKFPVDAPETACLPIETLSSQEKVKTLKRLMEAVRSEVHVVAPEHWIDKLREILKKRNLNSLLYAPDTKIGDMLQTEWAKDSDGLPGLTTYGNAIENFKETLFEIDAAITSTAGAIAETGALILWPTPHEPRLMSLVPPVHIAVVDSKNIYNTFCEVIQKENWPPKMPTNALLISGPSKTADIELTLAFGVHGPKELVVLILES